MAIERQIAQSTLAASLLLSAILFLPEISHAYSGFLESLSGTVYFREKGGAKWAVAGKDQSVTAGDSIKTGPDGRASIKLSDGSRVTIGNSSQLEITEFLVRNKARSGLFNLSTGKMRAVINKFSGTTDIKVKTPTSTSGVKGTEFIVMNSGEANVIFGKEKAVEVSGNDGTPVRLTPGRMTENTRGGDPIQPVKVEPGTALHDAMRQLEAVTTVDAPVEWEKAGELPDILARWNLNYGGYLADAKRFTESIDVFQIAIDLASLPALKAEGHLGRGTVLSRNMGEPEKGLRDYLIVIEEYPQTPAAENALFSAGMANYELGDRAAALNLFRRYLSVYPQGIHRDTASFFVDLLERQ